MNPASSCRTTMNDDTTIDNTAADDTTTTANAADDVTLSWRRSLFSALGYHLYTIYLFTYSSHKDVIYPGLVFSLSTALSSRSYLPLSSSPSPLKIIPRTPYALLQIYLSLLLFSLHNQHHPSSILKDTINKPWRPLPAGRISPSQTRLLLILGVYPLFFGTAYTLGTLFPTISFVIFTIYYCELGGCSAGGVARGLLNALGYSCFFTGGFLALVGNSQTPTTHHSQYTQSQFTRYFKHTQQGGPGTGTVWQWLVVICAVVFTTTHTQDFRDEKGDLARGRKTVQTTLGDAGARWVVVVASAAWSVVIPNMFGLGLIVSAILCGGAGMLAYFLLSGIKNRTVEGDIRVYKVWIAWFMAVILSPLIQTGLDLCFSK